jgi:molybdopterin biosynthesis enzyme
MVTAQKFVAAVENFAITRLFYEALVREGNVLAEDVATYEPNTPAHRAAMDRYERIQSAAASAQTALGQYELNLLAFMEGEYVDVIENTLSRLRIAGGTEAAKAIADQLESRYHDESQIPEEAR